MAETLDHEIRETPAEEFLEHARVEETPDGGAVLTLDNEEPEANHAHFTNLLETDVVDPQRLADAVTSLLLSIEEDKRAREERDKLYEEGLRRTGLGGDAPGGATFQGASKTVHPLLAEACVDFAARAMKELFPPAGPVKSKVLGVKDRKKLDKAQRKTEFMNWQATEQIKELRTDLEKLLTQVPLGGGQYLKWMFDPKKRRPTAEFVPIDDILLPFAASNFYAADRRTHVQRLTQLEFEARTKSGMYVEIPLTSPSQPDPTQAAVANDKIEGKEADPYNQDGVRIIYEVSALLDLEEEGEFWPYIISIDETTHEPLNLYRNWEENDETYTELHWIVEFPMIPWRGAYPIGLTHLIGGLTGAATGALRALLDSAHINNIPALLKLKSATKGENVMLGVTQMTELDGGLSDDIRKLAMAIPFNPPSTVLFSLLGFLIDAGKGVVETSFEKLADMNQNAPVGTTLALIEQGLVVFSSIHARLHYAMATSLQILHRLNRTYFEDMVLSSYGGEAVTVEDFEGPLDVIPVSDPNVFSDTQRFAQVQAVIQRADMKPQLYDPRLVEELFLRQLKVSDEVLLKKEEPQDLDPVSENVAMTMGAPAFVLPAQNHVGHLRVHAEFAMDQTLGANPVMAQTYVVAVVNHMRDHVLQYYLQECHKAVSMATELNLISDGDIQGQTMIIIATQKKVSEQLLDMSKLIVQLAQQAQQLMPKPPQDQSLAVAQLSAQTAQQATQAKMQMHGQDLAAKTQLAQQELMVEAQTKAQEIQLKGQSEQVKADLANKELQLQVSREQREARTEQAWLQLEQRAQQLEERNKQLERDMQLIKEDRATQRQEATDAMRYQMNTDDNNTAMTLAQMEIEAGEKVAVSTGTGINPNP